MLCIHNLYGGAPAKWKSMAGLKLLLNMWPEAALGLVASTFPAGRRQVRPGHSHFDWQRISIVLVFLFLVWLDNERCQSYQYVTAADLFTRSQHVTSSVRPGNGSLSSTRRKFCYFPTELPVLMAPPLKFLAPAATEKDPNKLLSVCHLSYQAW